MPKEKINFPAENKPIAWDTDTSVPSDGPGAWVGALVTDNPPGERIFTRDAQVQVGWHKDSWVQVSIEADRSYLRFAADSPDADTSARSTVYTPPLDRDEINKLIRVLRRARDQVFGRDE